MTDHDDHPEANPAPTASGRRDGPDYEIRVRGRLTARWSAWFDGFHLSVDEDGTTVLRGPVVDQSALHGLLAKVRDLGLPLVSVTELPPDPFTNPEST